MHYFCTLFDIGYAARGLAMINSLKSHLPDSHMTILCMDEQVEALFSVLGLDNVKTMRWPIWKWPNRAWPIAKPRATALNIAGRCHPC